MTNGGGGGEGGGSGKGNLFRGSDFAYALARMAVAQICEGVELSSYQESHHGREGARFSSFQETALERLTEVAIQYIQSVGKTTQFYANMAGRVEGNAMDIVQALEDLGSGLGFSGAPDVEHCLAESGVVKDIVRYTFEAEEVPFVYSLPRFPFNRGKRPAPSFAEVGAELPDEHIPAWLPAFPQTKMCSGLEEASVDKIQGEVQSNGNGLSLPSLQQSVDVDRLKVQKSMDQKDVEKPSEEPECNPFLAAPVWVGEKNVPRVFCPSQLTNEEVSTGHVPEKQTNKSHHIPPLEAYAPSGMIVDKSRLGETEGGEKNDDGRTQRALLRFKIETRKAPVRWTIKESLEEKGWFLEDGDKRKKNVEREEKPVTIDTNVK
ncbi:Bromodomain transcription factor [Raphanus sativus]|uniref:Transcription initiation factor TFIID subunit 8 n=1 Tax=Raphanus sativus TaxID=3726 RepID=A0A6J0MF16_RAPSA|nr:transcription initiation factor TFIID subunit 8 [Raphanus sativus]KAJ4912101.1 Bromodomain transcription factor [Raphanus sativus]